MVGYVSCVQVRRKKNGEAFESGNTASRRNVFGELLLPVSSRILQHASLVRCTFR
jgi:hypothetical protein